MRIFHVMASGARGGGADHLLGLLPAQQRMGMQTMACVGDDGPLAQRLRGLGIQVVAAPMMARRFAPAVARFVQQQAKAFAAEVLHAHGTRAACLLSWQQLDARSWTKPQVPAVYTAHGLSFRAASTHCGAALRGAGERFACWRKAAVISVSDSDKEALVARGCVSRLAAHHVGNAVRLERFAPASADPADALRAAMRQQLRASLRIPAQAQVVGTVSRLVPQKDVASLVAAVAMLPDVHLVVAGDGPARAQLLRSPLARKGRLHLLGARDDVPQLLRAFDVFALSSRWEGEPIALLEAMAAGVAWLATRTQGAEEIACLSETGHLVPIADVPAIAAGLQRLLQDAPLRQRMAQAGLQAVAQRSYAQQAQRIAQIYEQLRTARGA